MRRLLWDAGPGEIRVGLLEDTELTEFRIIRPRRQKAFYAVDEYYTARITGNLGPGKALVTLGEGIEALLEPVAKLHEGTRLAVQMSRPSIPEPGRWKRPVVRPAPDVAPLSEPGWHFSGEPWAIFLHKALDRVDEILCSNAASANEVRSSLGGDLPVIRIDADRIAHADFDSLIETAVAGEFPIEGGMLSIERTRAMTMIDIDGSGDPLEINYAAAQEIPRLLRLLDIGGQIGVDFLALPDRKARLSIDEALSEASVELGPHERTAINGYGFTQIIRPRRGPSIPEILCGTAPGRLSLESRAIALLRAAGRSKGHGSRRLVAHPAIIDLIRKWDEEVRVLRFLLGVEIELVPDSDAHGYGHVHVSQN
ncbi:MAG: ribonuclease E/G [Sphingorhabdus sp.]